MSKEEIHFVGQIAQKALIENSLGQILLVQYPEGDPAAGMWDLPGGRLNEGESSLEGLKREVFEEIGAEIQVHGLITTDISIISETFKLYVVVYKASLADPAATLVAEEGEIAKLEWRDKKDIYELPMVNGIYAEALKDMLN